VEGHPLHLEDHRGELDVFGDHGEEAVEVGGVERMQSPLCERAQLTGLWRHGAAGFRV
jgi:hypothetical protein